ncbi:alpha/beta fold hydrolase [Tsukamurella strandjordii]|uniref:Alpha/beta fold hydrolase n=1 Tax=Tsukamurella strandjordii TaxID=147577 RepID=A0AA90NF16_9ACTN|nr:alpha/beta fold hydrolase [Tsukamurella strandjordii]MDP0397245.1 alpha/beta fold hydrolase [Tsukamurella strandjordii]
MPFAVAPDGARLSYTVHTATPEATGPGLLLIAGQALGARSWAPLVDSLRAAGPVVVFDHRGVGESDDRFPRGWSTRDCAADALAVLDTARADGAIGQRADVYGFSMGGRAAQWLAADHPDRVRRLILGATSVGDRHGLARPDEVLRILVRSDRQALLELFFTPDWLPAHPEAAEAITAAPRSLPAQRSHFAASTDHDAAAALPLIVAPTLVLTGADDRMCLAGNAAILRDRISGAALRSYPGMRHGYHLQEPRATADALDFLTAP